MTKAQYAALAQAINDGGEIILEGMDCTEPRPRRDVVEALCRLGYLKASAHAQVGFSLGLHDYYRVTDAGEIAFAKGGL